MKGLPVLKVKKSTLLFSIFVLLLNLSVIAQFPAFPPNPPTLTNVMDRDQMVWQLGITFPNLGLKMDDPNKPDSTYPSNPAQPENNWRDRYNHTITWSGFGLWNNYDQTVGLLPAGHNGVNSLAPWRNGSYTPIDLLKMRNGTPVTSAEQFYCQRRPEIYKDVQEEFWGVLPHDSILPAVTFVAGAVTTGTQTVAGVVYNYKQRTITGYIDSSRYPAVRNKPRIVATLRYPANATGPVPVIIIFGGSTTTWSQVAPQGWAVCAFSQGSLQPDNGAGLTSYLIGLVNKGNWRKPNDWGALVAWGWGASKLVDYFATDPDIDENRVGVEGHSRYGKATIVAMAYDKRIAIGYPSCSGSLGLKMNRRHWGQDAENSGWDQEYHWMSGNFFKYQGRLNPATYLPRKIENCPVDAHSLLALCAPRPVFTNGGDGDSWSDPYGTYLAEVAANPVYELLGYKGMIMENAVPQKDSGYIAGQLGFRYHTGGHTDVPDWPAFVQFASKYFNDAKPVVSPSQSFNLDGGVCNYIGTVTGTDADAGTTLKSWRITAGECLNIFAIDGATGKISVPNPLLIDFSRTSYSIKVTVSDGYLTSNEETVTINIPDKIKVCHKTTSVITINKADVPEHIRHGDCIGTCGNGNTVTSEIEIYPNPAKDYINIILGTNTYNIHNVQIFDVSGRLVKRLAITDATSSYLSIPTNNLHGIYMVKFIGDKVITKKVIIE